MGVSTDGILAYGYDLGGEGEWKVQGLNDDGEPSWPWYDSDEGDLVGDVGEALAAKVPGVEVVTHCSGEHPMCLLASREVTAYRGWVEDVTDVVAVDLTADRERLDAALATLGIIPIQKEPRWLLVSYRG